MYILRLYGAGAAHMPAAATAQAAMHPPCAAEQATGALVSHAYQPTGPAAPATTPRTRQARHIAGVAGGLAGTVVRHACRAAQQASVRLLNPAGEDQEAEEGV